MEVEIVIKMFSLKKGIELWGKLKYVFNSFEWFMTKLLGIYDITSQRSRNSSQTIALIYLCKIVLRSNFYVGICRKSSITSLLYQRSNIVG